MQPRMRIASIVLALAAVAGAAAVSRAESDKDKEPPPTPDVSGNWTGIWQVGDRPGYPGMRLDATVTSKKGGRFEAVFQGECGRPYKYTIRMAGRQAGKVVLFKGSADLGKEDGGVYDWIGRANGDQFLGFFTSEGHTGNFKLTRPKDGDSAGKP